MQIVALDRFRLHGLLGSGANYEVYAATDHETNQPVVLKRPWAQSLQGGQYRSIDQLSARLIQIHHRFGRTITHVSRLVGYTDCRRHDEYFGDALTQEYHVLIEERARGVPLVADIRDKFRGIPIGLGQNLFALYPLIRHHGRQVGEILLQLLDIEEAFSRADYLVMDLRPQNVFFDPMRGAITVIDIGDFRETTAERSQTVDLHDCLAELCRFYLAPHPPPDEAKGYREPFGMAPPLGFSKDLDRMMGMCRGLTTGLLQEASMAILQQVKDRQYVGIEPFRRDMQEYFALIEARNTSLQGFPDLVEVWREGMALLQHQYWRKFLFDPETDLQHYA
jgi:serine/threonine protein kinase